MKSPSNTSKAGRDARLTAVNFVAEAVNRALDLKEIADNALHSVLAVMKLDAGAMYIWQEAERELRLFAWRGLPESFVRQVQHVAKGRDPIIDAVLNGESRTITDFKLASRALQLTSLRAGFESAMLSPIRAQGYVVGMLVLGCYRLHPFESEDSELIETISNQIGNALVHAQLQADLRASEEQYRSIVENSDDVIYITDVDGRPLFANSAFERTFGYSVRELAALQPFEPIHDEDAHAVAQAVSRLVHGESVRNLEYRFRRRDGAWIDLQCNARVFSRDSGNRVKELQFIVREVTDAKRRQQQLVRRNRQMAALTTLADVANSSLNIEEIARNTLEVAVQTTGVDGGCIHLADPKQTRLDLYVHTGLPAELIELARKLEYGETVAGEVAATGEARVVTDWGGRTPKAIDDPTREFQAIVVVPVRAKGALLGTLGLMSRHEASFTTEVVEMIKAMGNQLGIALANARLYEAQLRENEKLSTLVDIGGETAQRLELDTLLQRVLDRAAQLFKADAAYMIRFCENSDDSEVVAATFSSENLVNAHGMGARGLSGLVRTTRQGRVFTPAEVLEHGHSPILRRTEVRSVLVAPLISRTNVIGTITLVRYAEALQDFMAADLELMEVFASRAAVAIDNAELLKDLQNKNRLLQLLKEEAHHRIKNNLQMVSGLLQLQAEVAGHGDPVEHLRNANARIHAIAQVHNLLSQEMPEKVDANALINTIVDSLISAGVTAETTPQIGLNVEALWLSSEQAVAVALIVNELLSNALIHGQPQPGQPLRVEVSCVRQVESVRLAVSDNGGGFPSNIDWKRSRGQGMNIITQLAQVNLRGTLQISARDHGVHAEVTFDLAHPGAPAPVKKQAEPLVAAGA